MHLIPYLTFSIALNESCFRWANTGNNFDELWTGEGFFFHASELKELLEIICLKQNS